MKKILILSFLFPGALPAFSQKINAAQVPAVVKRSFLSHFQGSTARWEKEGARYEANFKKDGTTMSALFDAAGTMTESEITIKKTDLPPAVLVYIGNNFKGAVIRESAKITKADGTVNFEAEVNHKDLVFDRAGNYLRTDKD